LDWDQRFRAPLPLACQGGQRGDCCGHGAPADVERSTRFYAEVLGGRVVFGPVPVNVALASSWIVISTGGGPTHDKPAVTLETPPDPAQVSSFLNIRKPSSNASRRGPDAGCASRSSTSATSTGAGI
jgi:hypothetical protein